MSEILVSPLDEAAQSPQAAAPRLDQLKGKTIALFDISKRGGSVLLERLEQLLRERHGVVDFVRETKPTYTKPAPEELLERLGLADGVIEALAD